MSSIIAFCDESGKDGPYFAFGGFIANADEWSQFDDEWRRMLDKHGLPHLHINELNVTFKGRPDELAACLSDAVTVLLNRSLWARVTILFRETLERVAAQHGLTADPYAWGIYLAVVLFQNATKSAPYEMVIDRMERGATRVELARQLYASDAGHSHRDWPMIRPLEPSNSQGSDNTPALQAADLIAWEARNGTRIKERWFKEIKPTLPQEQWTESLRQYQMGEKGLDDNTPDAFIFDRTPLARLREARRVIFANMDDAEFQHLMKVRTGELGKA